MAIPLIVWGATAAFGTFGGIVLWGRNRAKLKSGDNAFVPFASLTIASPLAASVKLESLGGVGGLVKVENVALGPNTSVAGGVKTATGSAGKELGIALSVMFPVSAAETIERGGQVFQNPEKKA